MASHCRPVAWLVAAAATLAVLCSNVSPAGAYPAGHVYLSPVPGSSLVSPENNIVIRDGRPIDPASVTQGLVVVTGARSGGHDGDLVLSDDGRTLVFCPHTHFAPGEHVTVKMRPGVRTVSGVPLAALAFAFDFDVAATLPSVHARSSLPFDDGTPAPRRQTVGKTTGPDAQAPPLDLDACTGLPPDYPDLSFLTNDDPAPGYLFITPWYAGYPGNLIVLDDLGMPVFHRSFDRTTADFKVQPNGLLTYYDDAPADGGPPRFYAMDSTYAVVDSFETGNGYVTDIHELRLLPDGHALLMSYDTEPVRMDLLVDHGDPDALVTGLIIQELDASKHVVFQWRSWDHFKITDTDPSTPLTNPTVDYVHGNSIEVDLDGNLLISSRKLNEITKIDRQTGAIIWRFGPHAKNNEFTIVGDTRGFSHQHDARVLPNGHLTLFDNGNFIYPQYSRALEFDLDEVNKVATLVWSYRADPDVFGDVAGNVQRHPDGSTVIGWGASYDGPKVTELHPDGSKAFEMNFTPGLLWSYRAFRFPWRTTLLATAEDTVDFGPAQPGEAVTRPLEVLNGSQRAVTIACAVSTDPAFAVTTPLPVTLAPGERTTLELTYTAQTRDEVKGKVYLRMPEAEQRVAQDVWVTGGGNAPPVCDAAVASPAILWPPNHAMTDIEIAGVTDPDGDPVTITVTGVTQDEAVLGEGSGRTCPDAEIGGDVARVRAERAGSGNGRVYRIAFRAEDGRGGESEGFVMVKVPHDRGKGHGAVDDGQTVNALGTCRAANGAVAAEPADGAAQEWRVSLTGEAVVGSRATVEYTLAKVGQAKLSVYDLSGRRVRTLARGTRNAGPHSLMWDTAGLTPGIYFYRLRADGRAISKRVAIVR